MLRCGSNPPPYPGDLDALDEVMLQGDEKHPACGVEVPAFDIRVEHRFLDVIAAFCEESLHPCNFVCKCPERNIEQRRCGFLPIDACGSRVEHAEHRSVNQLGSIGWFCWVPSTSRLSLLSSVHDGTAGRLAVECPAHVDRPRSSPRPLWSHCPD